MVSAKRHHKKNQSSSEIVTDAPVSPLEEGVPKVTSLDKTKRLARQLESAENTNEIISILCGEKRRTVIKLLDKLLDVLLGRKIIPRIINEVSRKNANLWVNAMMENFKVKAARDASIMEKWKKVVEENTKVFPHLAAAYNRANSILSIINQRKEAASDEQMSLEKTPEWPIEMENEFEEEDYSDATASDAEGFFDLEDYEDMEEESSAKRRKIDSSEDDAILVSEGSENESVMSESSESI